MDWYYKDGSEQRGPVSTEKLREFVLYGPLEGATLVWNESIAQWHMVSDIQEELGVDLAYPGRGLYDDLYSECEVEPMPEHRDLGRCELKNIFAQTKHIWRRHWIAFTLSLFVPSVLSTIATLPLNFILDFVPEGSPIEWGAAGLSMCIVCWAWLCLAKGHLNIIDFGRCSLRDWFVRPKQAVSLTLALQLCLIVIAAPIVTLLWGESDVPEIDYRLGIAGIWLLIAGWASLRLQLILHSFADHQHRALPGLAKTWKGTRRHTLRIFFGLLIVGFVSNLIGWLTCGLAFPFVLAWIFCFAAVFYRTMHPRAD